jgi:hypothetical protein
MIGDPIASFVQPTVVCMSTMMPSRRPSRSGSPSPDRVVPRARADHLPYAAIRQLDAAQFRQHKARRETVANRRQEIPFDPQSPLDRRVDHRSASTGDNPRHRAHFRPELSFVTTPAGYCSDLRPVSQETRVQRIPMCTGSARCMMKDGKTSASPWPKAIRLPVPSP